MLDSNQRPSHYKCDALPTKLIGLKWRYQASLSILITSRDSDLLIDLHPQK